MEKYKQMSTRLGHGGIREGAGRKKKYTNRISQTIKISLEETDWNTIEALMKSEQKSKSEMVSELLHDLLKIK